MTDVREAKEAKEAMRMIVVMSVRYEAAECTEEALGLARWITKGG